MDILTILLLVVLAVAIGYVYTLSTAQQTSITNLLGNVQNVSTVLALQTSVQSLTSGLVLTTDTLNVSGTPLNTSGPTAQANLYPIGLSKTSVVQYSLTCTPSAPNLRTSVTFALIPNATSHNLLSVGGITASGIDIGSIRSVIDPANMLVTISFNATDTTIHNLSANYLVTV